MKAHIKLGRIFGVAIGLHYSWIRIALLVTLSLRALPSAEMVPHSFAQKVSQDQADYWDTDCGSWLCASNDVDHIAAKVQNQHHNR